MTGAPVENSRPATLNVAEQRVPQGRAAAWGLARSRRRSAGPRWRRGSLAHIRFGIVTCLIQNHPFLSFAQMCVSRVGRWRGGWCKWGGPRPGRWGGVSQHTGLGTAGAPSSLLRFQRPPLRTGRAVLPHPAHRRRSPPAFGFPRQGRFGRGATTSPDRLVRPSWLGEATRPPSDRTPGAARGVSPRTVPDASVHTT